MYMYLHERSVIETRQSKATTPEDNLCFLKRKRRAASGGVRTCDILRTRQMLYQLSHRGNSTGQVESLNVMQGQRHVHVHTSSSVITQGFIQRVPGIPLS